MLNRQPRSPYVPVGTEMKMCLLNRSLMPLTGGRATSMTILSPDRTHPYLVDWKLFSQIATVPAPTPEVANRACTSVGSSGTIEARSTAAVGESTPEDSMRMSAESVVPSPLDSNQFPLICSRDTLAPRSRMP